MEDHNSYRASAEQQPGPEKKDLNLDNAAKTDAEKFSSEQMPSGMASPDETVTHMAILRIASLQVDEALVKKRGFLLTLESDRPSKDMLNDALADIKNHWSCYWNCNRKVETFYAASVLFFIIAFSTWTGVW